MKRLSLFVLFWVAILFSASGQALETVRVGLSVRNVVFLPFYYAQDRKIFQKNGLDVELIQMRSDLQIVGVVSGELDFNPAIGPAIPAIGNGMPLKAVAVFYRAALFSLVSPGNMTHPKDLEGKKVAVSRIGSESHKYGMLMLEKSGVNTKKVTFIQTGSTAVSLTALQQGSVEAAVLSPPFTGAMAEKGFRVFMKSHDLVESPWLGLVTSRQKIQRQPEQVRAMIKAMREAFASMRQDKRGLTTYIRENFKVSPTVAEESYEDIMGVALDDLIMPEPQLRNYLDSAQGRGELSKTIAVNDIVDYSLIKGMK